MKIEMPDNNTIIIDDGSIVLVKSPNGNFSLGHAPYMKPHFTQPEENYEPVYDPHRYVSYSSNGLTVDDSTEKAAYRVYHEIWNNVTAEDIGDVNLLREVIRTMIVEGQGRQAVYALAGGIKKGFINGYYEGVPLAFVMKGYVDGHIKSNMNQGTPNANMQYASLQEAIQDMFKSGR